MNNFEIDMTASLPDGWFDLDAQQLADFGAMCFLIGISPSENHVQLRHVMLKLEPALRLNQYKIFRSKGFPRAFVTWAGLSPEVELEFAIEQKMIAPETWNGGEEIWIIDLVAPFGHADQIQDMIKTEVLAPHHEHIKRVRALRKVSESNQFRIVQWHRSGQGEIKYRVFTKEKFKEFLYKE